jgi:glucokinase
MRIGIDCGGTKTEAIVIAGSRIRYHIKLDQPSTKLVVYGLIQSILERYKADFIGIGFPAPIKDGRVNEVNNIKGWDKTDIEKEVRTKFRIPCRVENDAKCFVLAESVQKENRKYKDIIGITLGTGLGVGIIIDRRILRGADGIAGEIGRVPMSSGSYPGLRLKAADSLNLEDLTSKKFFVSGFGIEPKDILTKSNISSDERKIIDSYARNIGNLIALVCLAYDPECIVIGGSIARSWQKIKRLALLNAHQSIYTVQKKRIIIKGSRLRYAGCIGASLLN